MCVEDAQYRAAILFSTGISEAKNTDLLSWLGNLYNIIEYYSHD